MKLNIDALVSNITSISIALALTSFLGKAIEQLTHKSPSLGIHFIYVLIVIIICLLIMFIYNRCSKKPASLLGGGDSKIIS
ncbi:Uncharacterised protein [uncultured archaeon]|nr:Uncharacterised protein [uncultured archaeon]